MAFRVKAVNKGKEIPCGGNEIPSSITDLRKCGLVVGACQESPAHSHEDSLVTGLFSHTRRHVTHTIMQRF